VAVEIVYKTGLIAEFNGRTNTAIHAYTWKKKILYIDCLAFILLCWNSLVKQHTCMFFDFKHILCCVLVLFVFVLCILCCQFVWKNLNIFTSTLIIIECYTCTCFQDELGNVCDCFHGTLGHYNFTTVDINTPGIRLHGTGVGSKNASVDKKINKR
jgi:hypothetical protein